MNNTEAKILFNYASRSRPDNFFRGLDSIVNNLFDKENYHVQCSFDIDDLSMNNEEVISKLNTYKNLSYYFGVSESKVHAINRDNDKFPAFDILVNFSDDQIFTSLFFDRVIRVSFNGDYDIAVHFPDQATKASLITMSVMGVDYFDRFGYVYFPGYKSLHCDNEFMRVSQLLGKYKYVNANIFLHLHPAWKLAPMDAQYLHTESFYQEDGLLYKQREKNNFDLTIPKVKKLSILIPSLNNRAGMLSKLLGEIEKQIDSCDAKELVEIVVELDNGEHSIGEKRNILLQKAKGEYLCFIDDDDRISSDYLKLLLEGLITNPDCCSLDGIITFDGVSPQMFRHSIKYDSYYEKDNIFYRHTNHLNAIRSSIAKSFSFPEISHGEDTSFAKQVFGSGLLKREYQIPSIIYFYDYKRIK